MFRKEGTHLMRAAELDNGRGRQIPKGISQKRAAAQQHKGEHNDQASEAKSRQKTAKDVKKTHSEHVQMFRKEGTHLMRAAELDNGRGRQFSKDISQKRAAAQRGAQ
jgi:hypothetical protein